MTALAIALDLSRRGLSVIPIPLPRPGVPANTPGDGKTPVIKWKEFQTRQATNTEVRHWFTTEQNVAIITGAFSGLVTVDGDSPTGLRWICHHLPYTPWQTKTAKGYHLHYRHPGGDVRNKAKLNTGDGKLAIDIRGDGGYCLAPGSLHASGIRYQFAGDWSVPKSRLPLFCPSWMGTPLRK